MVLSKLSARNQVRRLSQMTKNKTAPGQPRSTAFIIGVLVIVVIASALAKELGIIDAATAKRAGGYVFWGNFCRYRKSFAQNDFAPDASPTRGCPNKSGGTFRRKDLCPGGNDLCGHMAGGAADCCDAVCLCCRARRFFVSGRSMVLAGARASAFNSTKHQRG